MSRGAEVSAGTQHTGACAGVRLGGLRARADARAFLDDHNRLEWLTVTFNRP